MRILLDYRSALRSRTGVGEYTHELVRALAGLPAEAPGRPALELTIFSSSWKDRLRVTPELTGVDAIDLRIPVAGLNLAWHRLEWPSIERLTGRTFDIAHSLHPLLMPARTAARVITIHDLNFTAHPERTRAEIRRDYGALAPVHARKADHVIVVSRYTAGEVVRQFDVPADHISVCSPGAPDWMPRQASPQDGYLLFLGTLEPRKNVGGLLDAYEQLLATRASTPDLVLAGRATDAAASWLERVRRAPLAGHVRHIGYVDPDARRRVYEGATVLVMPSFDEGFGIPALEAMTLGVPVVAARSGALPEVLGEAGIFVEAQEPAGLAAAIARVLDDRSVAAACATRGPERARSFQWRETARQVQDAYRSAHERYCARLGRAGCASA